jgi:16S rRNA (guanine1516-N2)-methyltransferase
MAERSSAAAEIPPGLAVWSEGEEDAEAAKLAARLGVKLYVQEEPPVSPDLEWLFFYEEETLFLHSFRHPEFKPLTIDYLSGDFARRWRHASRNDLLLKAIGLKKGVRTVCDPTCGLGYDAFFLATMKDLEVTACERSPVVAELTMNALLRVKEWGRFEELPLYFHFGDGMEFLRAQGEASFDAIYLDPMFTRAASATAKPKKEMFLVGELVGDDSDAAALFTVAQRAARKRVIVKRADDAAPLFVSREPDLCFSGKTVRYDVYLKT